MRGIARCGAVVSKATNLGLKPTQHHGLPQTQKVTHSIKTVLTQRHMHIPKHMHTHPCTHARTHTQTYTLHSGDARMHSNTSTACGHAGIHASMHARERRRTNTEQKTMVHTCVSMRTRTATTHLPACPTWASTFSMHHAPRVAAPATGFAPQVSPILGAWRQQGAAAKSNTYNRFPGKRQATSTQITESPQ